MTLNHNSHLLQCIQSVLCGNSSLDTPERPPRQEHTVPRMSLWWTPSCLALLILLPLLSISLSSISLCSNLCWNPLCQRGISEWAERHSKSHSPFLQNPPFESSYNALALHPTQHSYVFMFDSVQSLLCRRKQPSKEYKVYSLLTTVFPSTLSI